jgi:putative transposase
VAQVLGVVAEATERRICRVLSIGRSVLFYSRRPRSRDERLKAVLPELARELPRYGYRRLCRTVRERVEPVSRDTIQRLCQVLGLQVKPLKRPRRRRAAPAAIPGLRAAFPHHVWCLDFLKDRTADGRALRFLSVVDEHTRQCLALRVGRRFTSSEVVAVLAGLIGRHGVPNHLRSDNGPEFVATVVETWAAGQGIRLVRSTPASPWENPYIESFHSRLRDELVERDEFGSLVEAQVLAETYRVWYNGARGHSALRYQTPAAFAARIMGLAGGEPLPAVAQA